MSEVDGEGERVVVWCAIYEEGRWDRSEVRLVPVTEEEARAGREACLLGTGMPA